MHHKHNEYFSLTNKTICPNCKSRNTVYSWGSFVCRVFHRIKFFCFSCYEKEVRENLLIHQKANKCEISICGFRKERLPFFLLNLRDELNGFKQNYLPIPEEKKMKNENTNRGNSISASNGSSMLFEL